MAKAPPVSAAAAEAVMCVVAVCLAAAALVSGGGAMGNPVVGSLPLLVTARGSGRVEDQEPPEMDSEAHRRVVLALQGGGESPGNRVLDANRPWCDRSCPGKPGDPYVPDHRGCKKIYQCPSGT